MENLPVKMIRENLRDLPQHVMPAGYSTRLYRPGDEQIWVAITSAADEYQTITLETFQDQFKNDIEGLKARCFFLCERAGREIGTVTAWYDPNYGGREFGRIHWVAILPEFQGRGLSKPMMTVAMNRLAELHDRAYLATSTARLVAIKVYLDFGFVPDTDAEEDVRRWALVSGCLDHPILRDPALWHRYA